jgi:hypothetical protein
MFALALMTYSSLDFFADHKAHVSLEAKICGARRAWERSVTQLQQRQADLKQIEVGLDTARTPLGELTVV